MQTNSLDLTYQQGFRTDPKYVPNKDLVKKDVGDIFLRPPVKYDRAFDFDEYISDEERMQIITELFDNFLIPFTNKALSISGIKELSHKGEIELLPAVEKALDALSS